MTKRQAIKEVRALADAVIEQLTRRAKGWDKGLWRDDMPSIQRDWHNTIDSTLAADVEDAFLLAYSYRDRVNA